ncbi:TonB-dependent receptor [Tenacibaculum amylolyticum]|uniref:TonB-dependent receptor n=1 Tax=Tenacibaculum amylolyticum TaxID=104269 RepID=UPI0038B44F12
MVGSLFSQQNQEVISLKEMLFVLEKKHDVKFSFSDTLVAGKTIRKFSFEKSLKELLITLEEKTGLIFKRATARYIVILERDAKNATLFCGFVIDKYSKEPILGADVYLSGNVIGSSSDESGYFELRGVTEKDTIVVSFLGYKSYAKPVTQKQLKMCMDYEIEEYTSQLDEVLVTSYLVDGIAKNNDGAIEISPQKRGILPGLTEPDVLQELQLLPGIQSPNETTSGLNIRGGAPDQNLVLFDGIRIYNPAHFFGMISAFNPYVIDKVKVFESGAGVEYGNHVSGVIDIQTDSKVGREATGGIGANFTHADGFLKIPLGKKVSLVLSGRRSLTDAFNSITFRNLSKRVFQNTIISRNAANSSMTYTTDNRFFFEDFYVKLLADISEKDRLLVSQLYVNNKLDYSFGTNDASFLQVDNLMVNNVGFSTTWDRKWSPNLEQKTRFYYSNYELDYDFMGEQTVEPIYTQTSTKKNAIKEIGFTTSFEKSFKENHKISVGGDYIKSDVGYTLGRAYSFNSDLDYLREENTTSSIYALYSEYSYNKKKKFNINVGLRNTYFSIEKKLFVTPRIFMQFQLFPHFWVNSSYEKKQQNISQIIELSTSDFGLENNVWSLSNRDGIPILSANQFSGGFMFKKNNWLLDVNLYTKKVEGLTWLSSGVFTNSGITSNGSSSAKGITLLLKKKMGKYISWLSYGFGETKFIFPTTNEGVSFPGNNDIRHNFTWSHNYRLGKVDLSLGWIYRTGTPFTGFRQVVNDDMTQFIVSKVNSDRLNSYHRLDFSSTYEFNFSKDSRWKGKIGVSFFNIYDRENSLQRVLRATSSGGTTILTSEETLSLGFTPNMVFRVQF